MEIGALFLLVLPGYECYGQCAAVWFKKQNVELRLVNLSIEWTVLALYSIHMYSK